MKVIHFFIQRFSLPQLLLIAVLVRIVAVIFSKGFGFSDDHFETIALADEYLLHKTAVWKDGEIYLFNLIYPYFHALLMGFSEFLGFANPQTQMFVVRFFHALLNLWMIIGAGKLAKIHYGEQGQKIAVLFLGLFWMFPFIGVRSLREMACMPFVIWAFYFLEKDNKAAKDLVLAGLLIAIAFVIRIQIAFVPIGIGIYLLFKKQWLDFAILTFSTLFWLCATQGFFDWVYWGDPLGSVKAYVEYNLNNSGFYPNGPWYMYIFTVLGFTLPIFSVFLLWGFWKSRVNMPHSFWGAACFFFFHSYFPNKQERFILPFIVVFLLLGVLELWKNKDSLSKNWAKTLNISAWVFVVANTILLLAISMTYSKKSRVEAMSHFYGKETGSVVMCTRTELPMQPHFYHRKPKNLFFEIDLNQNDTLILEKLKAAKPSVSHLLFTGNIGLEETINRFQDLGISCDIEQSYPPSFVDNIAFLLNPKHNTNELWTVIKLGFDETRQQ